MTAVSPGTAAAGLAMLLGLAVLSQAQAKPPAMTAGCDKPASAMLGDQLGNVVLNSRPVPIYRVGEPVIGQPGEAMDAFALRASETFRSFTEQTQKESCATICRTPGEAPVYGVLPQTALSAGACPITTVCPDGMVPTKESIHTHGDATQFKVCDTDRAILGWLYSRGEVVKKEKPEEFSPEDFAGGVGYLVSPTTVWHQNGQDQVRQLQARLTSSLVAAETRDAPPLSAPAGASPSSKATR